MACPEKIIGGLVHFIASGPNSPGIRYEVIGNVVVTPPEPERTAHTTARGELYITQKAQHASAEIAMPNLGGLDPADLLSACGLNITIVEMSRGVRHLFTDARVIGRMQVDLATGGVSGLTVVADEYTRVAMAGG